MSGPDMTVTPDKVRPDNPVDRFTVETLHPDNRPIARRLCRPDRCRFRQWKDVMANIRSLNDAGRGALDWRALSRLLPAVGA